MVLPLASAGYGFLRRLPLPIATPHPNPESPRTPCTSAESPNPMHRQMSVVDASMGYGQPDKEVSSR
jgi:hypothetical protein